MKNTHQVIVNHEGTELTVNITVNRNEIPLPGDRVEYVDQGHEWEVLANGVDITTMVDESFTTKARSRLADDVFDNISSGTEVNGDGRTMTELMGSRFRYVANTDKHYDL